MDIKKQPLAASAMLALTFAVTAWAAGSAAPAADDKIVKLSGCLIRGEGDGAGYLLMNTSAEPWLAFARQTSYAQRPGDEWGLRNALLLAGRQRRPQTTHRSSRRNRRRSEG
jgi:hypothetical protein